MMIITDSASDITKQEALEMNIRIVSLKIRFSDGEFHQNTEEDFSVFFEKLAAEKDLPTTSQPSPEEFLVALRRSERCRRRSTGDHTFKWIKWNGQCGESGKTDGRV